MRQHYVLLVVSKFTACRKFDYPSIIKSRKYDFHSTIKDLELGGLIFGFRFTRRKSEFQFYVSDHFFVSILIIRNI